ncbi:MAG: cell division protein SepF [Firmicutes bacterium]|nr:cell division protein SepF [Bacillota bacterium]
MRDQGKFGDYIANNAGGEMEFFEDAHQNQASKQPQGFGQQKPQYKPGGGTISPKQFSTLVVFEPMNPDDVEKLIDYLKNREPAVVKIDKPVHEISQRILDMLSGAVYALNGTIMRIEGNTFIMMPEGVKVLTPN